jgi:hypothetical protein
MNTRQNLISRINQVEDQLTVVSERLYNPQISASDHKEISKKKKKLLKTKSKLHKKLESIKDV